MVRKDKKGVDLGIWKSIDQKNLSCPLDVHSGNIARKLGLINRKQNDHKAVLELDSILRITNFSAITRFLVITYHLDINLESHIWNQY